jgi:microcystin-dependent protein
MATPFLSELKLVSFNFAPKAWVMCNGQLMQINQNQALFSLLGTTYGGDGRTTFGLPNLQGRAPIHVGSGFNLGQQGGEYNHTLTISETPIHQHALQGVAVTEDKTVPANHMFANTQGALAIYGPPASLVPMFPGDVGMTGGSQAHTNQSPFLVMTWIIALQGIFPSQT